MAIAVASVSTNSAFASSTAVVITKPTGLTVGDLMIAHVTQFNSGSGGSYSAPAGWTAIQSVYAGSSVSNYAFYKVADSADVAASNFTFTTSATAVKAGSIYRITGGTVLDTSNQGTDSGTNASTVEVTAITQNYANSLQLMLVAHQSSTVSAPASSGYAYATDNPTWTEQYDVSTSGSSPSFNHAGASAVRANATNTGQATVNLSNTTAGSIANAIILSVLPTLTIVLSPTSITWKSRVANLFLSIKRVFAVPTPTLRVRSTGPAWTNTHKSSAGSINNTDKS